MKEHETGMMGLPLRLLAREVYDTLVRQLGPLEVALVTGEEKIVPPRPRYWICTVEAMPLDVVVDFLAVDEIQLAAHHERGHVFTDRLLRARGQKETWFLGAETMRPLIAALIPETTFLSSPRLSMLRSEDTYTLGGLPPRSAVVAFSVNRVYELAEKIRARKGGAAIVSGALSPRARNAQVAMYQNAEVDYLVATDAIGMGLNLDVHRIAFSETRKFDGRRVRDLTTSELAQIAGRAGRYQRDGFFGTYAPCPRLPAHVERAIEAHRFEALDTLMWRNPDLDFSSPTALLRSLRVEPPLPCLQLIAQPEDGQTLERLLMRSDIVQAVDREENLRLLFDVCQIPDYRKLLVEQHARLVSAIFFELLNFGRLRSSWLAPQLRRLAEHDGDVDSLTHRIAFVRTWIFVSHQNHWVEDARTWQEMTRSLEDDLSDALHLALVERFVRRRRSTSSAVGPTRQGARTLEQQLRSLQQRLTPATEPISLLERLRASNEKPIFSVRGVMSFEGQDIARLRPGRTLLEPATTSLVDRSERRPSELNRYLQEQTQKWARGALGTLSEELMQKLGAAGRGLCYQLRQGLGSVARAEVQPQIGALSSQERKLLVQAGVHFGTYSIYLPRLLKKEALLRRMTLYRCYFGALPITDEQFEHAPHRPSYRIDRAIQESSLLALGFRRLGPLSVRVDVLERVLAEEIEVSTLCGRLGCKKRDAVLVARAANTFGAGRQKRRRGGRRPRLSTNKTNRGE